MKRIGYKCIQFLLVIVITVLSMNSCIFKQEIISYSYENLSKDLLHIEYVNVTGEIAIEKEIEIYKTLTIEEQEYILLKTQEIEFKEQFAVEKAEIKGEALVFCYPTYKLYISPTAIRKEYLESYNTETGEKLLYNIKYNQQFRVLMDSIKKEV